MSTCETCKWWEDQGEYSFSKEWSIFNICTNPKCNVAFCSSFNDPLADRAGPYASDETGLAFWTGPEFGCIHHEGKG